MFDVSTSGPVVLDHLVGVEDVAPDLVAPARLHVLALQAAAARPPSPRGARSRSRARGPSRDLRFCGLRALVLALGDDPRREVGEPDRRVGLVDVLAAGAGRAVRVDPDLVPVELDLDVVLDLGQHLDEGERRLAALLGVVRADPDEPVDAALGPQPAVGAAAVDGDRRALEAGLLALGLVDDLGPEAVPLGPAEVHPQEHLGPVGRLRAARSGADREDRVPLVVLAREEERGPLALELRREGVGVAVDLGDELGVVGLGREVRELAQRVGARDSRSRPQGDLRPEAVGLRAGPSGRRAGRPRSRARRSGRRARRGVLPSGEVKDAPRSRRIRSARSRSSARSIRPGLATSWSRIGRSSISRRAVLLRATTGFTQGQYAVVGADAAVAVAVERGGVAAGPAVALARDQIDERGVLDLLHHSLASTGSCGGKTAAPWAGRVTGRAHRVHAQHRGEYLRGHRTRPRGRLACPAGGPALAVGRPHPVAHRPAAPGRPKDRRPPLRAEGSDRATIAAPALRDGPDDPLPGECREPRGPEASSRRARWRRLGGVRRRRAVRVEPQVLRDPHHPQQCGSGPETKTRRPGAPPPGSPRPTSSDSCVERPRPLHEDRLAGTPDDG